MLSPNPMRQKGQFIAISKASTSNLLDYPLPFISKYPAYAYAYKEKKQALRWNWKRIRIKTIKLCFLAIALVTVQRLGWSRQKHRNGTFHVGFSKKAHKSTSNNNFTKGHTKLSYQFVQNNKHNKISSTMPTSSLSAKRSSKLKKPDLESNERVEKIVRERKASSKLCLEAIKKKKMKEKEAEAKKLKKLERLREEEALAKMKEKSDEEFKKDNEIMEDIEKSSRELEEQSKELETLGKGTDNVGINKTKDINMVDMSQTADSETSESESESDSEDEDDELDKDTMEKSKNATQDEHDDDEKNEEIMDNGNTSAKNQDKENPSDDVDKDLSDTDMADLETDDKLDERKGSNKSGSKNGKNAKKSKPNEDSTQNETEVEKNHSKDTAAPNDISIDLLSYINSNLDQNPGDNNNSDDDSVGTATVGNGNGRDINQALNSYSVHPVTSNVVYCKAKIHIPGNEKPTEQLRNTLGMFLTTLLKVDKNFVLYVYKDDSTVGYIKLPTQVPEAMPKIKNYFHGRFRPNSPPSIIWPNVHIGFNIDSETFFDDAKSLLDDKGNYGLYKKDIQAAETTDVGFFLFSNVYQDRERVRDAILHQFSHIYLFNPQLTLRCRKVVDPSQPKAQ